MAEGSASIHPAPSRPAPPPRPPRDLRLDVMRGLMQIFIFVAHVPGSIANWWIHGAWGFSDSSEQFVLLSGYTLGSVFALKWARGGYGAAWLDMLGRTANLYRTQLALFVLYAVVILAVCELFPRLDEARLMGLGFLLDAPPAAALGAVTMLYQPSQTGILPVFVWCMLMVPPFMWLLARVGAWALVPSVFLYLVVQVWGGIVPSIPADFGIAFDPFAWQILFLGGAYLGRETLYGRVPLGGAPWLVRLAGLYVGAAFIVRADWAAHDLVGVGPALLADGAAVMAKDTLSPFRVLHALALVVLVGRFVPREMGLWHSRAGVALARCGRFSLQVFCVGVFLSYLASVAMRVVPLPVLLVDLCAIAAGIGILIAFAAWKDRRAERRSPRPAPAIAG
ncbi:MAG: OpgC domain-containing protein [Alphaproteobacteria bacterium]|nr:OpgC domain-containing protein [Alphaproteobacteria bacterium]